MWFGEYPNEFTSSHPSCRACVSGFSKHKTEENFMNKVTGLVLLVVGFILIFSGYNVSQSFSSDVSRFFTGTATNRALWMLVGGATAVIAGAAILIDTNNR
jgi:hypothetical protein